MTGFHHSKFGTAFRLAAENINARIKHDGFETSVIEVDQVDAQRFIESLHNTMDA
jgi:cell division control protein 45